MKRLIASLADLQNPPHEWHRFRIFAHNLEAAGSVQPLAAIVSAPAIAIFLLFQNTLLEHMLFGSLNE